MKVKTKNRLITLSILFIFLYVVVLPSQAAQKPVADFSVSKTIGYVPLKVTFTDESTGGKALWKWWGFGDGTGSNSTANTIEHTYKRAGTYKVFLKATNAAGSDTSDFQYITVTYKFDEKNGNDGKSPWGVPLKDLPVYKGYHLPVTEGYISHESQYDFIDDTTKDYVMLDPTDGNGYYINTLPPDKGQWKWNGKWSGSTQGWYPGASDHINYNKKKNIKNLPSGNGIKLRIYSPYTGKAVVAVVGENGPAPWTGRQFGASNKVFKDLGLLGSYNVNGKTADKGNPNPWWSRSKSDPVVKYTNDPFWVEVSWADQSLPAGPCK